MTKADFAILEKAFGQCTGGGILQTKSKRAKKLADDGYLQFVTIRDVPKNGPAWLTFTYEGYQLTEKGYRTCAEAFSKEGKHG